MEIGNGIPTDKAITNLIHAFTYRDISKESVMAIFETLIEIP